MLNSDSLRKSLVFGIIFLFIEVGVVPSVTTDDKNSNNGEVATYRVQYTVEFSENILSFDRFMGYDIVELKNGSYLNDIGKPMMPAKEIKIALPPRMVVKQARVIKTKTIDIKGEYTIFPAQPPRRLDDSDDDMPFIEPDIKTYNSKNPFPPKLVDFVHQTDLAGQSIAVIHLYPLRYVPLEKKLTLCTTITFVIEGVDGYECGDYLPKCISKSGRNTYEQIIKDMVINPEDVELNTAPGDIPVTLSLPPGGPYDEVIITSSSYETYWNPLVEWHTKCGLKDTVVTTSYIYSNYAGSDNQEKIRNFIIDAHTNWGTEYFLLAGEHGTVPFKYRTYYDESTPSDQYYSDYDDDWTHEVFVGRVTAEGYTQINRFIDKVLHYEKNPPITDYPLDVLLIGMDADSSTHMEYLKETIDGYIPSQFNVTKVYDSHSGNHRTAVISALNAGQNLVNHADHGWYNYMGTGDRNHGWGISNSDVDGLTNNGQLSVVVSLACDPNGMDYSDCIAEHFVIYNSNQAGVAFTGNTRSGWYYEGYPESLSCQLDKDWWRGVFQNNQDILGKAIIWSKHQFGTGGIHADLKKHCEWTFNLLGEPAMPIWTDTPASFDVTHPSELPIGPSPFTVHVEKVGRGNVQNAYVCLWKGDEVYLRDYTDINGDVTFNPSPSTEGTMNVTVTKHNYIPYMGTADVSSNPPEIKDNTPITATTGDSFTFNATVTDDTQVSTVWVEYWYGTGSHVNVSMINVANDYWEKTITIDDTLDALHYIISANDTSNNWNNTGVKDITISDNDKPEISNVEAYPNPQETGGYVNISCDVTDNVAVSVVKVNITYPNGSKINESMLGGSYYNATYTQLGTFYYFIWANDTSGNGNISAVYNFYIHDSTFVWIDDDFNASTPGWGIDHFDNIQNGINAVAEDGTVYVFNGTYSENVVVNKSINLTGEDRNSTIIDASGSGDVLYVNANWVNVSGFTIMNGGEEGIYLVNSHNCHVFNNIVCFNSDVGVLLNQSENNTISNCIVHNNTYDGVLLENSHYNTIEKTESYWNGIGMNGEGILLMNSNHCYIVNNSAYGNGEDGIILEPSSNYNNISDNEIYGNKDCGILISTNSNENTIYNNTAYNNIYDGILIETSSGNDVMRNHVHDNGEEGLHLSSVDQCTIKGNIIEYNNGYGIYLNSSSSNLIYNNYFNNTNNAWDNGINAWNITKTSGINIIGGSYLGGNYWNDYGGVDTDGDGLGDTMLPYTSNGDIQSGGDIHLLVPPNHAPVANFTYSPSSPTTQDVITFTDTSSDPDGNIVNWTWDFGDGDMSYERYPIHSYADNGTYNVTLTVMDDDGATNSTYKLLSISNVPPTADFTYSPCATDSLHFTDNSVDNDGSIINWSWNFGDGNISYDQNPTHSYADNNTYNVTLTVEDDDGATDTISRNVSIWSKRKPINLWVDSGETPADYQVLLNISYNSSMNSNFSDFRFIRYCDNTTELDYWIEGKVDGQWAHVWVEIADNITTSNETLAWMYYENAEANSASNGDDTFLFFDDFEDGVYRDKWSIDENTDGVGVAYQLWGKLFLRTKEVGRTISMVTDDTFATMFSDTDGMVLEHDVWTRYNPPYPQGKDGSLRSYLVNVSDPSQWVMGTYSGWSGKVWLYNSTGTSTLLGRTSRRTHNIHAEMGLGCNASYAWMNWSEINDPGWVEDDFNGSISTDAFSGATSVQIKLELHCGGSSEGHWSQVAFDNVRLRKYHDPEPFYYIGQ